MANPSVPQTGQQKERSEQAAERKSRQEENTTVEEFIPKGPLQTSRGVTTMDETVVAKISGMAAREVSGVYDMGSASRRAFSAVTDRIPNAQTNVSGGISVEKGDTQAAIDVTVVVEYGASLVEVGDAIRQNIIEQVEGTTGLEVVEVNIHVSDVHLPQEDDGDSRGGSQNARAGELR